MQEQVQELLSYIICRNSGEELSWKGIQLKTNFLISEDQIKGKFQINNPNFKNTDRSLNTILESTSSDFLETGGFKTSRTGFGIGTGFEQYSDLFINLDVSAYYEKLETSSTASSYKKKQEGDYLENLLSYRVTFNKLDQNFQPTDGYKVDFKQVLPIYSDDLSIGNTINFSKFHSVSDNLILSGKWFFKSVNSIDDDVRVSEEFISQAVNWEDLRLVRLDLRMVRNMLEEISDLR